MEAASDHGFPVLPLLYFRNLPAIRSGKPAGGSFLRNTVPACLCSFARSALLVLLQAAPAFPWYIFLSDVQDGSISDPWKNSDPAGNKPPFFHIRRKPAGHVLRIPERSGSVHVSHFHWQAADGSFFCCKRWWENSLQYPFLLHSPRINSREHPAFSASDGKWDFSQYCIPSGRSHIHPD